MINNKRNKYLISKVWKTMKVFFEKRIVDIKKTIMGEFRLLFFSLFFLLTIIYFSVPLFIMPDSAEYYLYLRIFEGIEPVSSWNVSRGPTFPLIIYFGTLIFGNSMVGILTISYVFFTGFMFSFFLFLRKIFKSLGVNKVRRVATFLFFCVFIMFNPILFGYYHAFYTEFVAIYLILLSCLLSWKWLKIDLVKDKVGYVTFTLLLVSFLVLLWFLKQPYITSVFSWAIAMFLSLLTKFSWKEIFVRFLTFCLCLVLLFACIKGWEAFLDSYGRGERIGRTNEYFLSNSLINGVSNLRLEDHDQNYNYLEDQFVSDIDKGRISDILAGKTKENFKMVRVFSRRGDLIDKIVFYYEGDVYSTLDALNLCLSVIKKHPINVLESYFANYLATINVFISSRANSGIYYPIREITNSHKENLVIGLIYMLNDDNFLWIEEPQYNDVENLYTTNNRDLFSSKIFEGYAFFHLNFFKVLFILLPICLVSVVVRYVIIFRYIGSKTRDYFNLVIILLGFSFLHTVFHAVTGAIIDRYVYVVVPEIVLALMILFMLMGTKGGRAKRNKV